MAFAMISQRVSSLRGSHTGCIEGHSYMTNILMVGWMDFILTLA